MKRFSIDDMRNKLAINKYDLDECCVKQPQFFDEIAEELAMLVSQRDEAKSFMEEIEAEANARVRTMLLKAEEKATDSKVEALVILDDKVKKAKANLIECQRLVNVASAVKESFTQRSIMLTQLTNLYVNRYYSDVGGAPKGAGELARTEVRRRLRQQREDD